MYRMLARLMATLPTEFPILTLDGFVVDETSAQSNSFSFGGDLFFSVYFFDFLYVFDFYQFYFEVSRCRFLFIYHTWGLQNILCVH